MELLQQIIELREQKFTSKQIPAMVGISKYTYEKIVKDNNLTQSRKIDWSPEVEKRIKTLRESGTTIAEMCKILDLKRATLEDKLRDMGLTTKVEVINFSEADIDRVLLMSRNGSTQKEIAKSFGISLVSLQRQLAKTDTTTKKYKVRHNYFETIDTEEKAYFLGLMYADGSNTATQNQIKLKLLAEDSYILIRFAQALTYGVDLPPLTVEITDSSSMKSLQISSPQICSDLTKWGCMQSKSHILEFPTFLNEELMRHFIRGYFDGDGSIFNKLRANKVDRYVAVNFTGNFQFITSLKEYIGNILDSSVKVGTNNESFQIVYSAYKDVNILRDYFYNNSSEDLRLIRKFKKFPSKEEIANQKMDRAEQKAWNQSAKTLGVEKPKTVKQINLLITNIRTGEVLRFKSIREAAKSMELKYDTVRMAFAQQRLMFGVYSVVEEDSHLAN